MDEKLVRDDITKMVYGDNYDHSQYENTLNCIHDFENFFDNLYSNGLDFKNFFGSLCSNGFDKFVKSLSTFLDDYNKSHKPE